MTARVNGAVVASAVALDTASLTAHKAVLCANYLNNTDLFDNTAFDGAIGEIGFLDAIAVDDATLVQAEQYLVTRWGVTPA